MKDARTLGEPHIPAERREAWDKAWRDLRATFGAIRASDAEAQERFTSAKPSADPLEAWRDVLSREDEFNDSLGEIQTIAAESIPATDRAIWKDFCKSLERQISMLEAHAVAVRFQLELRGSMAGKRRTRSPGKSRHDCRKTLRSPTPRVRRGIPEGVG